MAERESGITQPYDAAALAGPSLRKKREVPDGLWVRCDGCEATLYRKRVVENLQVCPQCGWHFPVDAQERVEQLTDPDTFEELFADVAPTDPLAFHWGGKTYADRLAREQERTGLRDAVRTGIAYVKGRRVALGVMDGGFLRGSMGSAVGEKITRLIERATEEHLPLFIACVSGGARMHEGALSLMQMSKTSAALGRFDEAGGLYVSLLTDPTTGGTTASFAMLADVTLAEPGALIGFAGPRVIANTLKVELPEGFQRAEFLLEHGFVDRIVPRPELRSELAQLIDYLGNGRR